MTAILEVIGSLQGNGLWTFQGLLSFFGPVNICNQFAIFNPEYVFSLFVLDIELYQQYSSLLPNRLKAPAVLLFNK